MTSDESHRASFLHAAAKLLYTSPIARAYEETAIDLEPSQKTSTKCPACLAFWVPGITCSVRQRTSPRNKNKRSRSCYNKRIDAYMASVAHKKPDFLPRTQTKLIYTCMICDAVQVVPAVLAATKRPPVSKGAAAKERAKKRKLVAKPSSQPAPAPIGGGGGLSLGDFLL